MIQSIQRKIGMKIALQVNLALLLVLTLGALFIYVQQSRRFEAQLLAKGELAAMLGAKSVGRILEEAIDNGALTLQDALDIDYTEIPGLTPPKHHTRYDWYTDKAILTLQDEILESPDVLYAVAQDINGYIPTHNTRYNQPITGDSAKDLTGNRSKRIFSDPVGLKVGKNEINGLLQVYPRDTGETVWDVSSPIYVKGKHWGGFRIGFGLTSVNRAKQSLLVSLGITMGIILLVSMASTFALINRALLPLREFTRIASDLADGNIGEKIDYRGRDEIGLLADVLERLRMSLKAAMDRLGRRQ
jgi:HAMP domain-containing protein